METVRRLMSARALPPNAYGLEEVMVLPMFAG